MPYQVKILPQKRMIKVKNNELLVEKLHEAGINLSTYCNKRGLCGKCFVEIAEGSQPRLGKREQFLLTHKGLSKNYRLACLYKIKGDLSIIIPEESILQEAFVLKTGIQIPISLDPAVKKYNLQLERPSIVNPYSISELLESSLKVKDLNISLGQLKGLQNIIEENNIFATAAVYKNKEILNIEQNNTINENFGIAVDLGTTTVVVELVNLNTGESLDLITASNSQLRYGSDVISRISFAISDKNNLMKLRKSILQTLNQLIGKLLSKNHIHKSHVYEIVVAGNSSMNHILLGMPLKSLARAPFHSVFNRLAELSAQGLGFEINDYAKVYLSPNIKSFVGGDVSAGLLASDFVNRKGNYLFIDLGTNGEIVLKTENRLMVTSTAAGPAFEGMNISCGTLALPGAIYKAENGDQFKLYTIGNKRAIGICGTGLIDLMALLLDKGKISAKGSIQDSKKRIPITENIWITQKDIREMQLAIAAIKAGIKMILKETRLNKKDLDGILIAGAFGNYLSIENSMKIGLLPRIDEKKIVFIGNSSLAGARALLLSQPARKRINAMIKKIRYLSLAKNPRFQKYFIDSIEFQTY